MKFSRKTEGAVSVFLVIILVPCLFVSALFVDVGRVYLSKGMAYSAADLALNTTMTQYDSLLNEYYGLVASCQNMDQFYAESANFFLRTISSQELEDEEVVTLVNQYAELMNDATIYDLLKTEAVGEIKIEPLANANLSNSTMLKEQIVEFMKYRGPITVVTEVVDRLSSQSNALNIAKDADENEAVVDAKEEYAEAEAELLEDAYEIYKYLYTKYSTSFGGTSPSNDLLVRYATELSAIREIYREVHELAIKNLVGTGELRKFFRPTVTLDDDKYSYTSSDIYSRKEEDSENEGSYIYIITASDWSSKLDKLEDAIEEFNTAKNSMANKMNSISHTTDTNQVQYWKAVSEAIETDGNYQTKVQDAGNKVADLYAKCYAMADCQYEDITPEMEERWVNLEIAATNLCEKYLTAGKTDESDTYLILVNRLESYSAANLSNINSSTLYIDEEKTVDTALAYCSTYLDTIIITCDDYIKVLDNLIQGKNGVHSISSLKNEAKDYDDKYDEYVEAVEELTPTAASTADSKNFKDTELENMEADRNDYSADINEESVNKLEERLKNIKSQYVAVKSAAEAMKYGSKTLLEIENYSEMSAAASGTVKESELGLTNTELEAYAKTTFSALFTPKGTESEAVVTINTSNTEYNLELIPAEHEGETGSVDVPELYNYLHLKFKDANGDKVEEVKGEIEDAEELQNDKNLDDVENDLFPSYPEVIGNTLINTDEDVRGVPCNALDGFGALITTIDSITSGNYDKIRDELYIAIYMMQMFSYATYEREGMYQLYDSLPSPDGDVLSLTSSNYTTAYEKVSGDGEGQWKSTITWDIYNKSLTNKMINSTNNPAYRCEVEYILYGNKTHKDNINAAFGNIFAIRAALNTVSVFHHYWSDATITAISSAASLATAGIVPEALIRVAILLVQSALETCNDMNRFAAGWPVELYKDKDDWQKALSFASAGGSVGDAVGDLTNLTGYRNNEGSGFFYSDYLTLFVCMGMLSEDKAESMVLRMGDVIQHNMKVVSEKDGYALSNSITHFKFTGKLEVEPLVVTAPLFNEYNSELTSEISWGQYELELIRGY